MQGKQQRQLPKMHLKFIPTKSLLNSPQTLKNQLCLLAFTAHLWIYSDIYCDVGAVFKFMTFF